jgi:hypothetical protein
MDDVAQNSILYESFYRDGEHQDGSFDFVGTFTIETPVGHILHVRISEELPFGTGQSAVIAELRKRVGRM